jgi:putative iron-dependent peroxidase
MLDNMFVGRPPGNHDRILDFSTAVTGCLFFVPSADFLDDPPEFAAAAEPAVATPEETVTSPEDTAEPPADGSLRVGSLKRSARL